MFPGAIRKINRDGTRNVFCPRCREKIGTVSADCRINTALCVVCQAADRGEVLPQHVVNQLRSKTLEVTPDNPNYDPMMDQVLDPGDPDTEFTRSQDSYFTRVLKTVRVKTVAAVEAFKATKPAPITSQKLAQVKKRKRLFSGPIDE